MGQASLRVTAVKLGWRMALKQQVHKMFYPDMVIVLSDIITNIYSEGEGIVKKLLCTMTFGSILL